MRDGIPNPSKKSEFERKFREAVWTQAYTVQNRNGDVATQNTSSFESAMSYARELRRDDTKSEFVGKFSASLNGVIAGKNPVQSVSENNSSPTTAPSTLYDKVTALAMPILSLVGLSSAGVQAVKAAKIGVSGVPNVASSALRSRAIMNDPSPKAMDSLNRQFGASRTVLSGALSEMIVNDVIQTKMLKEQKTRAFSDSILDQKTAESAKKNK